MTQGKQQQLVFSPGWRLSVFVLLFLPITAALGFWQLQRAEEKRQLLAEFEQRRQAAPVSLPAASQAQAFLPVRLQGELKPARYFLLDNQMYKGRVGYEVIVPLFDTLSEQWVLLSRGWVAGSADRRQLPQLAWPGGSLHFSGEIYIAPGKPFLLAPQQWQAQWPLVIQAVDVTPMAKLLQLPLYPYVVRLAADDSAVLTSHWQVVNMPVAKHTGYAVQWFLLAAVLLGLYVWAGLGRRQQQSESERTAR